MRLRKNLPAVAEMAEVVPLHDAKSVRLLEERRVEQWNWDAFKFRELEVLEHLLYHFRPYQDGDPYPGIDAALSDLEDSPGFTGRLILRISYRSFYGYRMATGCWVGTEADGDELARKFATFAGLTVKYCVWPGSRTGKVSMEGPSAGWHEVHP